MIRSFKNIDFMAAGGYSYGSGEARNAGSDYSDSQMSIFVGVTKKRPLC